MPQLTIIKEDPSKMGGITKSLAELTNGATPGSPDALSQILFAPETVVPFVTQMSKCTLADLISGGVEDADGNIVLGDGAGAALAGGNNNILIGDDAGDLITTGDRNVAIGASALGALVSANGNVGIGENALLLATNSGNTAIGDAAGENITTGARNVAIGQGATVTTPGANDQLVIGSAGAANYFIKGDLTELAVTPIIRGNGGYKSSDGTAGESAVILAAGLVSITVKDGLVVAHA